MRFARIAGALRQHPIRLGIVAALAVLIPLGLISTAPAAAAGYSGPKPTIVLVHGAWADGSSWSGEVARLQHDGYTVDVAPNPLRSLTFDTAYLKDFLSTISGPIILAAHSYGGAVITNAALGNPNIKALVFVDAFLPAAGENVVELSGPNSILAPAAADPTSVFKLVPFPGAPAGVVDAYVLPSVFIPGFANGLPPAQGAVLASTQAAPSTAILSEASGQPAWKTIPSYAVIGDIDKVIPEPQQEFMAKRAHAQIVHVNGGHLTLISHPGPVTALIERAARERG